MEPTPAAPAKKRSTFTIIAVIVVAILSLCCCIPGIIDIMLPSINQTIGLTNANSGPFPIIFGSVCIGAAVVLWIILLIVLLVRRQKK